MDKHKKNGTKILVLDAPTLIENDLHKEVDYVILVWVDNNTQIQRVRSRDSLMREDVINRINKIDKHDISYVLERCFKPGIISTAFVGQGVETDKLNSILENSKVAYKNSIDKKFLL